MKTLKRRRKRYKTDYKKRFGLLKSGTPRIVFRKTNKYVIAQYVVSKEAQDSVIMEVSSKELIKYGWPETAKGSLKSTTASYLIGYLIGKKILDKKLEMQKNKPSTSAKQSDDSSLKPIVDFGMLRVLHKSKVYAFLKGLIDSGIKINCKKEAFPDESRIKGEHMKNKIPFEEIKTKI